MWRILLLTLFLSGCGKPVSTSARNPAVIGSDVIVGQPFQSTPTVIPTSTPIIVSTTATARPSSASPSSTFSSNIPPRTGQVEMYFDRKTISYNQMFILYFENRSNRTATLDKSTFDLVNYGSGVSALKEPDISIKDFGSCNMALLPGNSCYVQIKNDNFLAPAHGYFNPVKAIIKVAYEGEPSLVNESSTQTTYTAQNMTIDLLGP